jgi:hypothetical protein
MGALGLRGTSYFFFNDIGCSNFIFKFKKRGKNITYDQDKIDPRVCFWLKAKGILLCFLSKATLVLFLK